MKNSIKAFFLVGALVQGTAVMGLEVDVTAFTQDPIDKSKIGRSSLLCPEGEKPMAGDALNRNGACTLQEGQRLTLKRNYPGKEHNCPFTLQNNKLEQGYCSGTWQQPIINYDGNKVSLRIEYCNHRDCHH